MGRLVAYLGIHTMLVFWLGIIPHHGHALQHFWDLVGAYSTIRGISSLSDVRDSGEVIPNLSKVTTRLLCGPLLWNCRDY